MGDMADFALEQAWDDLEAYWEYEEGHISHAEAYDQGIIDEQGFVIGNPRAMPWVTNSPNAGFRAKTLPCRYCGKQGMKWTQTGAGWRLKEPDGQIHNCADYHSWSDDIL
jgi:hypothetical protein